MRGTVRRNLTYASRGWPDDEIQRVTHATGLADTLAELPEGIDTWVTEAGGNLSAAQRQRIALARALMGNPPILLLDQPTAGLDAASKEAFRDVIARHQGTTLLVTNDEDELSLADQVWVLRAGRLVDVTSGEQRLHERWLAGRGGGEWSGSAVS
jgi:ABC-type multidrug transport system fused ATPase/permease subunit